MKMWARVIFPSILLWLKKNALGKSYREYQNLFNAKYMFLKIVPFTGLIQEIRQRDYYDADIRNWKIGH